MSSGNKMLFTTTIFMISSILISNVQANQLTNGFSNFAKQLYAECPAAPENVIISPYSVATALSLLMQATNGTTFDGIKNQMLLQSDNKTEIAQLFAEHHNSLLQGAGALELSIVNQIYVQNRFHLNRDFQEVATNQFFSGVESVDFAEPNTTDEINHFIEVNTKDKIKNLIQPGTLNRDSRAVLINAVYFNGEWENAFKPKLNVTFFLNENDTVRVDFMKINKEFNYARLDYLNATALEMKYKDSEYSFVIILPYEIDGLAALEAMDIDLARITKSEMRNRKVDVSMPKFKHEFELNLKEVLDHMGLGELFDDSKADFSCLLHEKVPLSLSDMVHKAVIDVNEKGTEAAAVTVSKLQTRRGGPPVFRFHANHPFKYYIWHAKSETVLFSGRVAKF